MTPRAPAAAILGLLTALLPVAAFGQTAPKPAVGAALAGLTFTPESGFIEPRALSAAINVESPVDGCDPDLTGTGHEDSAFITADGTILYFAYMQLSNNEFDQGFGLQCRGPGRPGQNGTVFDLYEATLSGGWTVRNSVLNVERGVTPSVPFFGIPEASLGVNEARDAMVYVRFDAADGENGGDLHRARNTASPPNPQSWQALGELPSPVSSVCVDDNAHIVGDLNAAWTIYFDSNRSVAAPASTGDCVLPSGPNRRAWRMDFNGSSCVPSNCIPTEVPGINASFPGSFNGHVFVKQGASAPEFIYWLGDDPDTCCINYDGDGNCDDPFEVRSSACIYRADWDATGQSFSLNRTRVAVPTPIAAAAENEVDGIGEPSVTADGRYIYFVYRIKRKENAVDPDRYDYSIGVARKAGETPGW